MITSQNTRILRALSRGAQITPLMALKQFGSLRLGGRIFELRALGHKIVTTMTTIRGARVACYSLQRSKA